MIPVCGDRVLFGDESMTTYSPLLGDAAMADLFVVARDPHLHTSVADR